MAYLIKFSSVNGDIYKMYYDEPSNPYVITSNGTHFGVEAYEKILDEERDVNSHTDMLMDFFPINGWSDTCENDMGIDINNLTALYLLNGKSISYEEPIEIIIR